MVVEELEFLSPYDYTPVVDASCYEAEGTFVIVFGLFLTFGIWLSWLPQQVEFYRKKSTFGVSSVYIVLTQVANWTPFVNALFLDWDTFVCCTYIPFGECAASLLAIFQLGVSTFSVFCIYVFYVIYYDPTDLSDAEELEDAETSELLSVNAEEGISDTASEIDREEILRSKITGEERAAGKKKQMIIFVIYHILTAFAIAFGYVMILIWGSYNIGIIWYSYILGTTSAVVVFLQFAPQIYITYKLKTSGSLSFVMLVIQTPGTWVWFFFLLYVHENWSTWLSTFMAAAQVTILFGQVVYYEYIMKKKKVMAE